MPSDDTLDELERQLYEQLAYLQQQYQRAAEPIVQQLIRIRDCRPQRYMIPMADAIAAGLFPKPGDDHGQG
jgi:hypothetical protein